MHFQGVEYYFISKTNVKYGVSKLGEQNVSELVYIQVLS